MQLWCLFLSSFHRMLPCHKLCRGHHDDHFGLHQFSIVCGKHKSKLFRFSSLYYSNNAMDPSSAVPLDPMQMTQQIQTLAASVEELTKQNEELRQHVSHENSNMPNPHQCRRNNDDDKGHTSQPIIEKKVPDKRSGPILGKQSNPIAIMPMTK